MKEKIEDIKQVFEEFREKVSSVDLLVEQQEEVIKLMHNLEELIEELECLSNDLLLHINEEMA
jgi:hypothetical protein